MSQLAGNNNLRRRLSSIATAIFEPGTAAERLIIAAIAVLFGLIVGALFILWVGKSPLTAYAALWSASFGSWNDFGELLVSTTPLIFTGLAVALSFRCGLFNIGAEGQFIVGQIAAAWAGVALAGLPPWLHVFLSLLAGLIAGALWGALPGYLKAARGAHEVITTIMMNYIALYLVNYLVMGPLKGHPFLPQTATIANSAMLWRFLPPSRANDGFFLALLMVGLVYYILWKTTIGYEMRAVGLNQHAARYGGISVAKSTVLSMVISGGLAGLGGAVQVLGVQYKFFSLFAFTGVGFDAIAVALLGANHPFGVLAAAFLFGVLARSATLMQTMADIPKDIIGIIQAVIIVFVAADRIIRGLLGVRTWRRRGARTRAVRGSL